jgi:competence ComEA-like helix-hairpin-helix protein
MLPPDRRPLFGLIVVAAIVIAINLGTAGFRALMGRADRRTVTNQACVYQVVGRDGSLRTLFLEHPLSLAQILGEARGAKHAGSPSGGSPVPCGSVIRDRGTGLPPIVERMTGRQLVAAGQPVDVNRCEPADLIAVPGLGPVLAQRIVDFRQSHGPFSRIEDLGRVPGIGPKKVRAWQRYLLVSGFGKEEPDRRCGCGRTK